MSLRPGSCPQPEGETIGISVRVAPQPGQLSCVPSETAPHQRQVTRPKCAWGGRNDVGGAAGVGAGGRGGVAMIGGGAGGAAGTSLCATFAPHPTQKFAVSGTWEPQCVQNIEFAFTPSC